MIARMSRKSVMAVFLALILVVCSLSSAEILLPETTKTQKTDGELTVDCGHMDQGYVMVKGKKTNKRLKVRIKCSGATLNYDLNSDGEFEVFPLQFGNAKYQVILYKNASGKKYGEEGKVTLSVKMDNELSCFLYPNQYVNYNADTECVKVISELCKDMTDQSQIFKTVCDYIKANFVYDFIKSVSVKPGTLPDIDDCWNKHMGICQDLSAMACAMLRSQGIPARLMIGTLGASTYHAWVVAVVNGEEKFYDPTAELNASSKTDTYTTERYY